MKFFSLALATLAMTLSPLTADARKLYQQHYNGPQLVGKNHGKISAKKFRPYIGLGYKYLALDYRDIDGTTTNISETQADTLNGIKAQAGFRYGRYFGAELTYTYLLPSTMNNVLGTGLSTELEGEQIGLDLMAYYPLYRNKLELVASTGVAYIKSEGTVSDSASTLNVSGEDTSVGLRAGVGLKYNLTNKYAIRSMVHYQDENETANSSMEYTVDLQYAF